MHKKVAAELVSLANSILEMKNDNDVAILQKKAQILYEKLTVLKFVEANLDNIANVEEAVMFEKNEAEKPISTIEIKEEIIEEPIEFVGEEIGLVAALMEEEAYDDEVVNHKEEAVVEKIVEEEKILTSKKVEAIFNEEEPVIKDEKAILTALQFTLEDEFKDAISADVATQLFERVTKDNPVVDEKVEVKQKSLNDSLFSQNIQVGLNDRIAFVKHLFDGSQEDFNRVLSQLNSFKTQNEAMYFIEDFVKPDYNWEGKQEYEERLMNLIDRKFS